MGANSRKFWGWGIEEADLRPEEQKDLIEAHLLVLVFLFDSANVSQRLDNFLLTGGPDGVLSDVLGEMVRPSLAFCFDAEVKLQSLIAYRTPL